MSQAYELGLGEVPFMEEEPHTPQIEFGTQHQEELADVLPVNPGILRASVQVEALEDLAEVVDLDVARNAVHEAYNIHPLSAPLGNVVSLLPTGTTNEQHFAPAASTPQLVTETFVPTHESTERHEYSARGATFDDIERLVDVDMQAFEGVYKDYGDREALRAELIEKFTHRLELVGSDWLRVFEKDGEIAGFMNCCPTSKTPEEFESWEKTTDNGTLETTYDPDGKNIYIVSLSMLPGVGEGARNMLFADQIGRMIEGGFERAFFESRLPGLAAWTQRQCKETGQVFEDLTTEEKASYAEQYFKATKEVKGKQVPLDRLIRIYSQAGCNFTRVVPDAYEDVPSMNFGAVGIYENPVPKSLRNNWLVRKGLGKTVQALARSHKLMSKAF